MDRKKRFFLGILFIIFIYALPLTSLALSRAFFYLILAFACFAFSIYWVHRVTIRNIKPKYPLVPPEGHPDVYTGRMPRPIYEDMQRYPWLFKKEKTKKGNDRKLKKKH